MLLTLLALASASPGLDAGAYERAVDLVDGLYLHPEQLDAAVLLHRAAEALADEIHWLQVQAQGASVNLLHGDGRRIGSVTVGQLQTLPAALAGVEQLVQSAGALPDGVDVRMTLLQGLTRGLDRYSRVLSGDGLERFDVRLKGTLVGVGFHVVRDAHDLRVGALVADGPGERAGLRPGERLLRVDGRATVNMPEREAARLLRGEPGSPVVVQVERDGQPVDVELIRAEVVVPNVRSELLADGVAYVHVSHMSQRTVENLRAELLRLDAQGALTRGLVLDLRHNTGGSMKESARTADEFVDEGLLLRTVGPDGGRVRNLQAQMEAVPGTSVPPIPVAVLVDERTASGAEIVAGALVELGRAVLVGARTFGKGTVQKIYPLGDDARLKLTVARYLLANDRGIADGGIVPDLVVAPARLDQDGLHRGFPRGLDEAQVLVAVDERPGWREREVPAQDLPRELARRAVLAASAPTRDATLVALREVAAAIADEQDQALVDALAAHGIDWSRAPAPPSVAPPRVDVTLQVAPDPDSEDTLLVQATVHNRAERGALHRVMVELGASAPGLDGLAIPVGRVDAGVALGGWARVPLRAGERARQDEVELRVLADGRRPWTADRVTVRLPAQPAPLVEAVVSLDGEGAERRATVQLVNRGARPLDGLEVHFAYPGDVGVELIDQGAWLPTLAPGQRGRASLRVRVTEPTEAQIPLRLEIESEAHGLLARWPVALPVDGASVALSPPRIEALAQPLQHPALPLELPLTVADDGRVDHVVVYHDGHKVAWSGGAATQVSFAARVPIHEGVNHISVHATDDQGLVSRERFVVRGVPADGVVSP